MQWFQLMMIIYIMSKKCFYVSGGLDSNIFKIEYKPNPTKTNNVPSDKGGIVIIEGQRLSSSIYSTTLVKIGNYPCSVISSTVDSINDDIMQNTIAIKSDMKIAISNKKLVSLTN
ncbi:hypothetical protein ACTFIV_007047 [Dictyostelium citrinum]